MAGIGADIAEVINELGVLVTIVNQVGQPTEKITYESDGSSSRSFYREYALNAEFVYTTLIQPGDVLFFNNLYYMVAHKTLESFENEPVEYTGVLYKNNIPRTALLLSQKQTQDPVSFAITQDWDVKETNLFGLLYRTNSYTLLEPEVAVGREVGFRIECVLPAAYNVLIKDRIQLSPTEYYRVQDTERFKFPGLHVLTLVEDERPAYVPVVTP